MPARVASEFHLLAGLSDCHTLASFSERVGLFSTARKIISYSLSIFTRFGLFVRLPSRCDTIQLRLVKNHPGITVIDMKPMSKSS